MPSSVLTPQLATPRVRQTTLPQLIAGVAVVLTVALRLYQMTRPSQYLDGDQAVTGIMADNIRHGHLYIFYAGQNYGGALEAYLQAAVGLLPVPHNPLTLRIPQLVLAGLVCYVVYLLAAKMCGTPWAGCLAAVLYATGPFFNIYKGSQSDGFYLSAQLTAVVSIGLALRLRGNHADSARTLFGIGLCLGLTVWLSLSGLVVLLPVTLWALPSALSSARLFVLGVAGVLLGALPLLLWSVRHATVPISGAGQPPTTYSARLHVFFQYIVAEFVGAKPHINQYKLLQPPTRVLLAVGAIVLLWWLAVRIRAIAAMLTLRVGTRTPFDLLLLTFLITPWLYASSPYAWFEREPRYIFVLYPALVLAVAGAAQRLSSRRSLRVPAVGVAVVFATAWAVLSIGTVRTLAPGARTSDAQMLAAAKWMRANHIDDGYASYWTAMPLMYLSNEKLRMATVDFAFTRFPHAERAVQATSDIAYVNSERDSFRFGPLLTAHGVTYHRTLIGTVEIFSDLSRPVRPADLGLVSALG